MPDAAGVLLGALVGVLVLGIVTAVTVELHRQETERVLQRWADCERESEPRKAPTGKAEGGEVADTPARAASGSVTEPRGRRSAQGPRHLKRKTASLGARLSEGTLAS